MGEWRMSHRADPRALPISDRHYNRQKPGTPQFVPPGRCFVLLTPEADALWVTSWPFAEYVKHRWPGLWVCSCFRNESVRLSSGLICEAVAATRAHYGTHPNERTMEVGAPVMVTFVDAGKTRRKRDPGRCFLRAGFVRDGKTQGGLHALVLRREAMPEAVPVTEAQMSMWSVA